VYVGVCKIELLIPGCSTLKEKRKILKSVKERIFQRFKVSIAEVDHQDKWQRTELGIAMVSNETVIVDQTFSLIERFIENDGRTQILNWEQQIY